LLDNQQVSGKKLFALKRIAEALQAGFLTAEEAKRAAGHISPQYGCVFDCESGKEELRAAQVIGYIDALLQTRFPTRFRAGADKSKLGLIILLGLVQHLLQFTVTAQLEQSLLIIFFLRVASAETVRRSLAL
jgi:hypothetical protein